MEEFKVFISKFTPYLEDIRRRLYFTAIFFVVAFVAGFLSTRYVIKFVLSFFRLDEVSIVTTSPFQFADLSIDIGLFCAFLFSFPIVIYNIYSFLRPALSKRERKVFFSLVPVSLTLFVLGFAYGFAIMYFALIVLAKINTNVGIQNIWDIGMFLSQIVLTSSLLGVLFEFPIVMTYIIRLNIIDVNILRNKRRLAIFIIFIFVTLLPPTDGISLLAMAMPLVLLYEITIFVNSQKKRDIVENFVV